MKDLRSCQKTEKSRFTFTKIVKYKIGSSGVGFPAPFYLNKEWLYKVDLVLTQCQKVHATLVEYQNQGVMIIGPSGSGKSDLALRLIEKGGRLVADDQVFLRHQHGVVRGYAPEILRGLLEVRGVGILRVPYHESFPIHLVIDLGKKDSYERLPESETFIILEKKIPKFHLWAFEASIVEKIRLLLFYREEKI